MDIVTYALLNKKISVVDNKADAFANGLNYIGAVDYYADLPNDASVGDVYTVKYQGSSGSAPLGIQYVWGDDGGTDAWIQINTSAELKEIEGDCVLSTGAVADKVLTTNGDGTSGWKVIYTYKTFPVSWVTNSTTADFCASVNADATAVAGMVYLGELTCSDLPSSMVNVECVAEVIDGTGTSGKVIHLSITSGNVAPYRWEFTYWDDGSHVSGWISFVDKITADSRYVIGASANNIIPRVDNEKDLGGPEHHWKDLYLGGKLFNRWGYGAVLPNSENWQDDKTILVTGAGSSPQSVVSDGEGSVVFQKPMSNTDVDNLIDGESVSGIDDNLIDGTMWVFNDELTTIPQEQTGTSAWFKSNNRQYYGIGLMSGMMAYLKNGTGTEYDIVYDGTSWVFDSYKTIVFANDNDGIFLPAFSTWFSANAVPVKYVSNFNLKRFYSDLMEKLFAVETISTAGSVSQALDAGKIYNFTGALTALTITLNAADSPAQYHFSFESGATPVVLTLPNDVIMPDDFSVDANTRYEIDILNGYGVVCTWAVSGG